MPGVRSRGAASFALESAESAEEEQPWRRDTRSESLSHQVLWGHLGWASPAISHLRLGFYTSDTFAPDSTMDRDVAPILAALRKIQPDIVTERPRAVSLFESDVLQLECVCHRRNSCAHREKSP